MGYSGAILFPGHHTELLTSYVLLILNAVHTFFNISDEYNSSDFFFFCRFISLSGASVYNLLYACTVICKFLSFWSVKTHITKRAKYMLQHNLINIHLWKYCSNEGFGNQIYTSCFRQYFQVPASLIQPADVRSHCICLCKLTGIVQKRNLPYNPWFSALLRRVVCWLDTNVSEGRVASVFWAEGSMILRHSDNQPPHYAAQQPIKPQMLS
jgi:hypothetical protein